MEIKIIQEKNNPLLKRKELLLEIDHSNKATPSREELANEISKMFNVEKEKIVIDYILSIRGCSKSKAKVKIYEK
ncbi:MAG: 30S ribosomal protein S24e [Candidatus Aenigmatarchaeota archaeon]|nr:30S ribosomal protein S24e [Candidatus Aenigmarchaeota archaeon]